jgi:predicted PurR-regulated permease PerM
MIGHGLEVPMPVILLGVIGGVIAYGLVGLFIGAVLLAVGWVLVMEWLDSPTPEQSALPRGSRPTLTAAE